MTIKMRAWLLAATASLAGAAMAQEVSPNSVRTGVEAWQAGNHEEAIRLWRPLADRNDADAQYNIAQAYFLGRGVPRNMNLAEQWYERAARQGHEEAQGALGLILFQNGRRREAMPWIQRAADRGDPRAQYVLGTALFNGDLVDQDSARAYALMSAAAASGLPPAITQLAEMEHHISAEDKARGTEIARTFRSGRAPVQTAEIVRAPAPPQPMPRGPRATAVPPSVAASGLAPRPAAPPTTPRRPDRPPAQAAPRPAPMATPSGRWRIQLGAFGSEAGARRAWSAVAGRLPGLTPYYVRAGAVFRLQAGPLANRAAADRACAAVRQACFPVAP